MNITILSLTGNGIFRPLALQWAPHYAEKEALYKAALKPHTYYRYLDEIFIVWPHGEKAFHGLFDSLNNHEPPIRFKATLNKWKIDFLDTTIIKNPEN